MPIHVACPSCATELTAPDESAGATVDCRKCGTPMILPGAAPADVSPQVEILDDPEDADRPDAPDRDADEDDRPRKKKKKKGKKAKKAGVPKWVFAVAGGAALVLVLVVGTVVALWPPPADKTVNGVGWYKAEDPEGWFTAYFPGRPAKYEKFGFRIPQVLADKAKMSSDDLAWSTHTWERTHGGVKYAAALLVFPKAGAQPGMMEQAAGGFRLPQTPGIEILADEMVTAGGHPGRRIVSRGRGETQVFLMFGLGSHTQLMLGATGGPKFDPADPTATAFFENFTFNQ